MTPDRRQQIEEQLSHISAVDELLDEIDRLTAEVNAEHAMRVGDLEDLGQQLLIAERQRNALLRALENIAQCRVGQCSCEVTANRALKDWRAQAEGDEG